MTTPPGDSEQQPHLWKWSVVVTLAGVVVATITAIVVAVIGSNKADGKDDKGATGARAYAPSSTTGG